MEGLRGEITFYHEEADLPDEEKTCGLYEIWIPGHLLPPSKKLSGTDLEAHLVRDYGKQGWKSSLFDPQYSAHKLRKTEQGEMHLFSICVERSLEEEEEEEEEEEAWVSAQEQKKEEEEEKTNSPGPFPDWEEEEAAEKEAAALSPEQEAVLKLVMEGKSCFFTGCAGTGKSYLLGKLIEALPSSKTFVTATTGMAALDLGGTTLHKFAGIRNDEDSAPTLFAAAKKYAFDNWKTCRVLIVDEVSMLSAELFTKLDHIAKQIRGSTKPFGGIQLIMTGDFHQLPPVKGSYLFQSRAWKEIFRKENGNMILLKKIFRQRNSDFIDILQEVRTGQLSEATITALESCTEKSTQLVEPTMMHSRNVDVDRENDRKMRELTGREVTFTAIDSDKKYSADMDREMSAVPRFLKLKEGSQVIVTKNMEEGIVNGTRGVIIELDQRKDFITIALRSGDVAQIKRADWEWRCAGKVRAKRSQFPLKPAWCLTIHKVQGQTLDAMKVSFANVFEKGQAYVALSRARDLQSITITDFNPRAIKTDPLVTAFYSENFIQQQE